ncbi:MAG TPA: hypothetical protein VG737_15345 [Cyclobacteriaceae bacterium]|nr:hypothetical protein [Cyclobacteriaceae bacterium]
MRKSGLILFVAILVSSHVAGQNLSAGARRNVLFTDLMNGLPIARPATGIEGDPYLNPQWKRAAVKIYDIEDEISNYKVQYNLFFDELAFQLPTGVKAIDGSRVERFVFNGDTTATFVNAKQFTLDGTQLRGFFQVLVDGPSPLLKKYYVIVKDPDYNPALNSGSRNTRITKHSDLYYAKEGAVYEVKGKKKLLASFGTHTSEMEKFMKEHTLYPNDEKSLITIFTKYNSLLKP